MEGDEHTVCETVMHWWYSWTVRMRQCQRMRARGGLGEGGMKRGGMRWMRWVWHVCGSNGTHVGCTGYARRDMHPVCTRYARGLYEIRTWSVRDTHVVCTRYARGGLYERGADLVGLVEGAREVGEEKHCQLLVGPRDPLLHLPRACT